MCVCVLCSYSVVETKNHTRMRCLKIGHPKIPRLIIVSEYSKWPEIGERPHFWAPISPLYCIPSPLNPYCCWSFLVASPSNIPIVKRHSYWLLVLTISHISGHWILHISGRSLVRHVSFVDCPGHATRSTRSRSRWIWLILILTFKVCKDKNINTYCEAYHIHTIMCTHTHTVYIYICTVHVWGQNTYICVRFFSGEYSDFKLVDPLGSGYSHGDHVEWRCCDGCCLACDRRPTLPRIIQMGFSMNGGTLW